MNAVPKEERATWPIVDIGRAVASAKMNSGGDRTRFLFKPRDEYHDAATRRLDGPSPPYVRSTLERDQSMDMQQYLKNHCAFPRAALAKHRGEWVAWSPHGTRLVATTRDPAALDALVCAAGENPKNRLIEGVPDADCVIGGLDASCYLPAL